MRDIRTTKRFERDLKKAKQRGNDLRKLWRITQALVEGRELAPRHRPHKLSGQWRNFMECHVEQDWLLIWHGDNTVTLVRTGTHSDLFG